METYQIINLGEIIKGSHWGGLVITFFDDEAQTSPIDLDGCTILLKFKTALNTNSQATFSTESATITITGADNNIVTVLGRNIEMGAGDYLGDLAITFPNTDTFIWYRLKIKVIAGING